MFWNMTFPTFGNYFQVPPPGQIGKIREVAYSVGLIIPV